MRSYWLGQARMTRERELRAEQVGRARSIGVCARVARQDLSLTTQDTGLGSLEACEAF